MAQDPVVTAQAVVALAVEGRFAELWDRFAPELRAAVPAKALRTAWSATLAAFGPVSGVDATTAEPKSAGLVRVSVLVTGEQGGFTVVMSAGDDGLLHGLRFAPAEAAWTAPSYADPGRFTERDLTLGAAGNTVGATLTVPRTGRGPGVVLLAGGGPFDRDGTSGPNKPMKDLAWGLASRGVTVLRFDKITHPRNRAAPPGFTMADEYVPHAVEALDVLGREPSAGRVFVVGHSMGGKVAPRVAAAAPVAGLALLAADAQPMHHAAVRVARHLAATVPGTLGAAAVEDFTRQAELIDSPRLTPETPPSELPFGWSGSYWLDLRGYDPVAAAARSAVPLFLAQGGRDYQVTVADDLGRWQAGLAGREDVTVRVYASADHLFFPGEGPSTPAGYTRPGHVEEALVADLTDWLTRR